MLRKVLAIGAVLLASVSAASAQDTSKSYAPISESALGPAMPDKGYLVGEFGDGAYWVTNGTHVSMFVVSNEGVIVIDAPQGLGKNILSAVKDVTDQPIKYFVYSHHHADHVSGSGFLSSDVKRVAQDYTAEELRRAADPNRPQADITFDKEMVIELGDQRVELSFEGPNHTPGNIFIYLPRQKVLMAVDVLYTEFAPFQDFAVAESVPGFYAAFDRAFEYDFEQVIGGHLNHPGTREQLEEVQSYILDVRQNAADALASVDFSAIAGDVLVNNPNNQYAVFKNYFDAVAQTCADATEAKWAGRLAAADIWSFSNCWTMQLSLRVD